MQSKSQSIFLAAFAVVLGVGCHLVFSTWAGIRKQTSTQCYGKLFL
jgi:hypothetical protein